MYCGKPYHIKANCFKLCPDLKKMFEDKKKKKKEKKIEDPSKRQKMDDRREGDNKANEGLCMAIIVYRVPEIESEIEHVSFMVSSNTEFLHDIYVVDTGCF